MDDSCDKLGLGWKRQLVAVETGVFALGSVETLICAKNVVILASELWRIAELAGTLLEKSHVK